MRTDGHDEVNSRFSKFSERTVIFNIFFPSVLFLDFLSLRLCTGRRESRGIALPFLDHGTRRG
jgi:hypothetical protein